MSEKKSTPQVITDSRLMKQIAKGSSSASRKLFDRHSNKVFAYAKSALNDERKAEAVSKEIWVKVVDVAPTFKGSNQLNR